MKLNHTQFSLLAGSFLALCIVTPDTAIAREYHVSPRGDDANDGSAAEMLKTITAAAKQAQPGDVITVHEGTYRERIDPPRGGTSDGKRIIVQSPR